MLKMLLAVLCSRMLWGMLGLVALSAVIWIAGPLLAIGDYRPLEPEINRVICLALLWLAWATGKLLVRLYNAWLNRKLVSNLDVRQRAVAQENKESDEEARVLRERFDEAMTLLKKARFGETRAGVKSFWRGRFSRQYLYQLPWYVIIGAPGAGKTTALINSGLHFPLAERFGKTALRGVGGTRNCDWWFTSEAVLLDTAGRYTTQESQRELDASEWQHFIRLLKKYRGRQPINGTIITVSIADLLSQTPEQRHQQANALRLRLLELYEELNIRFPIYVLVTKADLLRGFSAYFDSLDKAGRSQIWGFTFPWAELNSERFDLQTAFDQQFGQLQQRLNSGLIDVLPGERDSKARGESYLFPQEFASLRLRLSDYLQQIFSRSGFSVALAPRGIYFASGTQEGEPFDKVMGELNRALQITRPVTTGYEDSEALSAIPPLKGQSFFLHDLLKKVIFPEAGLAGSNRWWELRNRAAIWSGYLTLGVILLVAAVAWFTSYGHNRAWLEEVAARVSQLPQQKLTDAGDMFALLPYLNRLQQLTSSEQIDIRRPPLSWRMGLYRGNEVGAAATALYQKALQRLLLPQAAQKIASWLRNDNGNDTDFSYEALKAYLMLYQPEHYDGKFLHAWLMLNLRRDLPQNVTRSELAQLDAHLAQLLNAQIRTSPFAKDEELIAREKKLILRSSLAERVYGRLKRLLMQDERLKPISLAMLAGPQSELVFRYKSGRPLTEGIPGLFTPEAYWNRFDKEINSVTAALHADDAWLLPEGNRETGKQVNQAVRQHYIEDYIRLWDELLDDIELNNVASLAQRINSARLLSENNSPLRELLLNLSHYLVLEMNGIAQADEREEESRAANTLRSLFGMRSVSTAAEARTPEQRATFHFAPFLLLAQPREKGGKAIVFDTFLQQIDELYRYLTAVQGAANSGMPPPDGEAIVRLQASAGRLPGSLQKMLTALAIGASADTRKSEMNNVRKRVGVELGGFCRQAIAGRYPLLRNARAEITPGDLAQMFAPGSGLMDTFFRENLAGKVDTSGAKWRFIPGIDGKSLPGSESMLRPFQQAQSIRDAFFSQGGTTPSYRVTVRVVGMDNEILAMTLDVDGQLLRYSHGPQVQQLINWPGSGGSSQVRLSLELADGTSSTRVTSGAWALNRFFDQARQTAGSHSLSRRATLNVDGHKVMLEFTPNSMRNPFQLSGFSCP
ncbi:type VI secretion system membrane subunit TssM [Kalamiella sp. sgz302252]|uniref:type VI secretion system membrane subunit TssM n=1 Tax=Pantoea sp. sgz302252 TaxID=3341827 RepID=UPI0036D25108